MWVSVDHAGVWLAGVWIGVNPLTGPVHAGGFGPAGASPASHRPCKTVQEAARAALSATNRFGAGKIPPGFGKPPAASYAAGAGRAGLGGGGDVGEGGAGAE